MTAPPEVKLEVHHLRADPGQDAREVSHAALRKLLSERLGVQASALRFGRARCPVCGGPNGRPVVTEPAGAAHFSLARDGDQVLVAIAEVPVGVDVEAVPGKRTVEEVTTLLGPAERERIAQAPNDERPLVFARLWTRKEALLKAIGTGIAHGLEDDPELSGWSIEDLEVPSGYAAAVALRAS